MVKQQDIKIPSVNIIDQKRCWKTSLDLDEYVNQSNLKWIST